MIKHKKSFHSHTYLCRHAEGIPLDYLKEAFKQGYQALGISEHAPMPYLKSANSVRMDMSEFPLYLSLLEEGESFAKKHNIAFYKGLEIEYFPEVDIYESYLRDLDYLILGQHYIIENNKFKSTFRLERYEQVELYRNLVMDALKTGYFNMLCHPEICFNNILNPSKEMYELLRPVIKLAKELNIPIELNANGIRKAFTEYNSLDERYYRYPRIEFLKMVKEEGAPVIIGSDTHKVNYLHDWAVEKAYQIAHHLELNIVYDLKMNYYFK